jgi:hypothetical protein
MVMRKIGFRMLVTAGVILMAAAALAQTNLTVVRHADNTLWKMTCDGTTSCSSWTKISGRFSVRR